MSSKLCRVPTKTQTSANLFHHLKQRHPFLQTQPGTKDMLPISTVENKGFKWMLKVMDPIYIDIDWYKIISWYDFFPYRPALAPTIVSITLANFPGLEKSPHSMILPPPCLVHEWFESLMAIRTLTSCTFPGCLHCRSHVNSGLHKTVYTRHAPRVNPAEDLKWSYQQIL